MDCLSGVGSEKVMYILFSPSLQLYIVKEGNLYRPTHCKELATRFTWAEAESCHSRLFDKNQWNIQK